MNSSGNLLALISPDKIHVWDVLSGSLLPPIKFPEKGDSSVAFSPDMKRMVSMQGSYYGPVGCGWKSVAWRT
jgi:WD40 repeat protein